MVRKNGKTRHLTRNIVLVYKGDQYYCIGQSKTKVCTKINKTYNKG